MEEKGTTEDEIVGWHHPLNGHEFEQALGVGDGQGGLVCCSPWGHKESDTTEQMKTDNAICSMQKKKTPRYLTKDNILIASKHMKKYLTHAHQKSLKDIHSNFILKNGNSSSVYQRKKTKCSIFIQWNILYSKTE